MASHTSVRDNDLAVTTQAFARMHTHIIIRRARAGTLTVWACFHYEIAVKDLGARAQRSAAREAFHVSALTGSRR